MIDRQNIVLVQHNKLLQKGKKMKPLIGVSGVYEPHDGVIKVRNAYMECIFAAGGIPVLLPLLSNDLQVREIGSRLNGVVFTGGGDVTPSYYGAEPETEFDQTEPERDAFEIALFKHAMERKIPILGICRGMQLIAVACGAKLKQHIENHSNGISHEVVIHCARLCEICGADTAAVNSHHMQAVVEPGTESSLRVCACAKDGTIEAIMHKELPFCLGVQWHPERLPHSALVSSGIFSSFVSACSF